MPASRMTTTETGRRAENVAAAFLQKKGCQIISQNWRTRWCEIDVIAKRNGVLYFCEVKYRVQNRQGSGLDYITSKKLQQMRFAAEFWITQNNWIGECQLCAIEVSGPGFKITRVVKDL